MLRILLCCGTLCLSLLAFNFNLSSQAAGSGDALVFDGNDEYINFNDVLNDGDFTIEFWFNPSNATWSGTMFDLTEHGSGATRKYFFVEGSQSNIKFWFESANDADVQIAASTSFSANTWYHVAAVGGFNRSDDHYLYINGERVGTSTVNTDGKPTTFPSTIWLGQNQSTYIVTDAAFPGQMDELRIWSDIRTQSEIRDNMCKKLTGAEANLDLYYSLDGASNVTDGIKDGSSGGNDATMNNMEDSDVVTSSLPLGDAIVYDFGISTATSDLNLASSYGDDLTIEVTAGTADALYLYRVDAEPNVTTAPGTQTQLSQVVYYGVKAINPSGFTYTVTYNYDGHPGITDESVLELAKRDDNSDATWSQETATLNTGSNTLTLPGQTGTEYILASVGTNTLPIDLVYFDAEVVYNDVQLSWQTASEVNNDYFTIERSANGFDWQVILRQDGMGNSSQLNSYFALDNDPISGISYYRLKQTDFDGSFEYFDPAQVEVNYHKEFLHVYPNPTKGLLNVFVSNKINETTKLTIRDNLGAIVYEAEFIQGEPIWNEEIVIEGAGMYFVHAEVGKQSTVKKVIVE